MKDPPARKEEGSLLGRFSGFLRHPGQGGEDREPEVIFKDPVAEPPRGAPPSASPDMIIPLRKGKGCSGGPPAPPQQKEEQPPPE